MSARGNGHGCSRCGRCSRRAPSGERGDRSSRSPRRRILTVKLLEYLAPLAPVLYAANAPLAAACALCPLRLVCPLRVLVYALVYAVGVKLIRGARSLFSGGVRLEPARVAKGVLAFCTCAALLALPLWVAYSFPGADVLTVEPKVIMCRPGGVCDLTIKVRFAHPQPCQYPDWKILYNVSGPLKVVDETKTTLISRFEAVKRISLKVLGNGSVVVVYHYGTGCPYGTEERAVVKVVAAAKPAVAAANKTIVVKPAKPPVIVILEQLYNMRAYIYVGLLFTALASVALLVTLGPQARSLHPVQILRYIAMTLSVLLLFVLPAVYIGSVCPCPLAIPQYLVLAPMTSDIPTTYLVVIVIAIGVSLILRRAWCGWICPLGFVQEVLGKIYGGVKLSDRVDRYLRYVKYLFLELLIIMTVVSAAPWICRNCFITPLVNASVWSTVTAKLVALFSIGFVTLILMSILIPRFFCRYICPAGALLELLGRFSIMRVRLTASECIECGTCAAREKCPMGVGVTASDSECISCLECVIKCPFDFCILTTRMKPVTVAPAKPAVCASCGTPVEVSAKHLRLAARMLRSSKELEPIAEDLLQQAAMCSRCRRAATAENLAEAYEAWKELEKLLVVGAASEAEGEEQSRKRFTAQG